MKLRIIMADPAGNRTAIVRTPVPADQRAAIAAELLQIKELRAEQAGFETSPLMGAAGRLEMMGGEFCGNAARSYGYLLRKEKQSGDSSLPGTIEIEISGCPHPLEVFCDPSNECSYARMPMPVEIEYSPEGYPLVISEGITHMILEDTEIDEKMIRRLLDVYGDQWDAFGMMFLKEERLTPVVYVAAAGSLVYESSCGSGSLAAAWYLEKRKPEKESTGTVYSDSSPSEDGRPTSYCFQEPGGLIRVDILRKKDGSTTGRMGGALSLEAETEVEI